MQSQENPAFLNRILKNPSKLVNKKDLISGKQIKSLDDERMVSISTLPPLGKKFWKYKKLENNQQDTFGFTFYAQAKPLDTDVIGKEFDDFKRTKIGSKLNSIAPTRSFERLLARDFFSSNRIDRQDLTTILWKCYPEVKKSASSDFFKINRKTLTLERLDKINKQRRDDFSSLILLNHLEYCLDVYVEGLKWYEDKELVKKHYTAELGKLHQILGLNKFKFVEANLLLFCYILLYFTLFL